jgi:hypothetical protein
MFKESQISKRLHSLEQHLKQENPVLLDVVGSFRELDRISRRIGFFHRDESHAIRTPWWPLISVLGIYSSGKSAFINHYLQYDLQPTGNQAVDDKFTVTCFTGEDTVRVLPGLALDADPRFPLYQISQAIEEVAEGEGRRIDAYLQLKTCPSEKLRGKIIIDSPGFDADAQRNSTLRITNHIINLSDLVLVFFDARHPESGSMNDTLEHLVAGTIHRRDSNKFLYILNQIDATAHDDNPEEVFAAWRRSLSQHGLTAGHCFAIYNPELAIPIANDSVRTRFENKRDTDLADIYNRIEQVKVERAYRIVGMLEQTAHMLEKEIIPHIHNFRESCRRWVLLLDSTIFAAFLLLFFVVTIGGGYWEGVSLKLPLLDKLHGGTSVRLGLLAIVLLIAFYIHLSVRRWASKRATRKVLGEIKDPDLHPNYSGAFQKNSRWWRSVFNRQPAGWGRRTIERLGKVVDDTNQYIQKLNDQYTNPSGEIAGVQEARKRRVEEIHPVEPHGQARGTT